MKKKYYRYCPIILKEEAYKIEKLNDENTYIEHDFKFQKRNDFGFIWLYEYYLIQNIKKHNLYGRINYYCYKEDENFFDLITGELLTPIDLSKNTTLEDKKIYIDIKNLEEESVSQILCILKLFPKREVKNYNEYLLEIIKTKSPTEYFLENIYDKYYLTSENKEKIEKMQKNKEKKLEKQLKRLKKNK